MARRDASGNPQSAVSIREASEFTEVEIHTLRYWEKEFAGILNPIRTAGGQRRYRQQDINVVFLIKRLLREEMYSIAGAKQYLRRLAERKIA